MARRDNQGLQISLIVFVMLTVILAVTTYIFWNGSQDLKTQNQTLRDDNTKLSGATNEAIDNATKLKVWIGHSADTGMSDIEAQYNKDMQTYAGGLVDVQQTYKDLPAHLLQTMQKRYQTIAELTQRANQLDDDLSETRKQLQNEVADARRIQRESEAALLKTQKTWDTQRDELNKQKDRYSDQVDQTRTMLADLRTKTSQEIATLQDEVKNQDFIIERRDSQIKEITTTSFETPDGKITSVNSRTGMVYLNLGAADGLQSQVTFTVYGVDVNNLAREEPKGSIEVTRIVGDHLSEARITDDDITDPMVRDDVVYTPLWNSQSALHFALAGVMDVNGDGRDDREMIKRLIRLNHGTIDAEEADGEIKGEMTHHTRYLILGDSPTVSEDGGDNLRQDAWTKIINRASDLGVESISYQKLLDFIGYDGEKRTIPLGRWSRPTDFDEAPRASGSVFRERQPLGSRDGYKPPPVKATGEPRPVTAKGRPR